MYKTIEQSFLSQKKSFAIFFFVIGYLMTFVIVMGFHQIIVVMNDVKRHTYIHTYILQSEPFVE